MNFIQEENVVLTEVAAVEATQMKMTQPELNDAHLRLYLSGKGCDGFTYGVCFAEKQEGDHEFVVNSSLTLLVDPDTFEFVKGSKIDWVDDDRGRGFLVENPKHKAYRGKFYKAPQWQERLKQKRLKNKGNLEETIFDSKWSCGKKSQAPQ